MDQRYRTNPEYREKKKVSDRLHYQKNRKARIAHAREYRMTVRYGLTTHEYNQLWDLQHGKCAICGDALFSGIGTGSNSGNAHVDHDHTTKIVRGLLCNRCNLGIGCFLDSIERLESAIKYLRKE